MEDIIQQLSQVVTDWQTLGLLAGLVALIKLLTDALKLASSEKAPRWLSKAFGWIKPAWRPWVAVALGFLGATLAAAAEGASWPDALITGVLGGVLGLGATGTHEAIGALKPSERAKKDAAAAVSRALDGPEAEVKAKVEAMKADLDRAAALPDKKARLKALADAANARR
jgi:hypothetical protein